MKRAYETLQDIFDETCEICSVLRTESWNENRSSRHQNVSDYRHALLSQYHDLVQLVIILKKDLVHKQIRATPQRLRAEEDYDLADSWS